MQDSLQKYGHSFQTKTISSLLTDAQFLDTLTDIIKPIFFESEANKWLVSEIIDYHALYKKPPTLDVFKVKIEQLENPILKKTAIDQLRHIFTQVGTVDLQYIKDEFTRFCINQNLKQVILKSVDLLKLGEYDKIKTEVDKAMKVGINTDLGMDYKVDFEKRYSEENRSTIPTGWEPIDELMNGGLGGGELAVVVAPSGVGKCVGGDTKIDIEYDEIGFELENGYIIWQKPWDIIRLNDKISITASDAQKLMKQCGVGKTM